MEDEVEDVVGDVKLTESQKSVTISNVYSMDFTDSSSEKHNSSGMDTYVLEFDSEDSESSALQGNVSVINTVDRLAKPVLINGNAQCKTTKKISRSSTTSINRSSSSTHKCSIIAQEIFTQTSKTIIELAELEGSYRRPVESKTLETQTSLISITENKTVQYAIEVSEASHNLATIEKIGDSRLESHDVSCHQIFPSSINDGSSKFLISDTDNEKSDCTSDNSTDVSPRRTNIANYNSKDNISLCGDQNEYENTSVLDHSPDCTDMEEDSLMEPRCKVDEVHSDGSNTPGSVDDDVAELYTKLSESMEFRMHSPSDHEKRRFGYLTPLTEEAIIKKDSTGDVTASTPAHNVTGQNEENDKDVLFTNNAGIKVKLFPKTDSSNEAEVFRLPPIQSNTTCPDNLNFLFTPRCKLLSKSNLPCVQEERKEMNLDWWEVGGKNLAAGESTLISGRSESERGSPVQLPPIHAEVCGNNNSRTDHFASNANKIDILADPKLPISIREKIKELKLSHKPKRSWAQSKYMHSLSDSQCSRSSSPSSISPDRLTDAARGCELLCIDLLKRLRSHSWFEIADTLNDLPRVLEKFWGVIAEHRIADLIRQVTAHIESPRTQVARGACSTLAMILKNTKYTKKPDFYEAVTILLIKTGSFSRPVRRAANVALDDIVCSVDLSHSVTALCIHGSCHKSPLVRCASARLLVVCCALGSGGRDLLRARPPTAACARRHALRSLAMLLDDKSTDARKYAERLYTMLRPLSNFEAYYLTDVDVDVATRQMKKYDQLLLCEPQETR